jgi:hypothetical protein
MAAARYAVVDVVGAGDTDDDGGYGACAVGARLTGRDAWSWVWGAVGGPVWGGGPAAAAAASRAAAEAVRLRVVAGDRVMVGLIPLPAPRHSTPPGGSATGFRLVSLDDGGRYREGERLPRCAGWPPGACDGEEIVLTLDGGGVLSVARRGCVWEVASGLAVAQVAPAAAAPQPPPRLLHWAVCVKDNTMVEVLERWRVDGALCPAVAAATRARARVCMCAGVF